VIYVSHRLDEVLGICDEAVVLRDGVEVATEPVAALTRPRLIELMLGEEGKERSAPVREHVEGPTAAIRGLTVPGRVASFDLELPGGRIVGLAGQLGSGANEVLRAVAGLVPNASGEVALGGVRLRLGSPVRALAAGAVYVSNDRQREGLFLGQSASRNLTATRLGAISRLGILSRSAGGSIVRRLAEIVGFDQRRLRSPVAELSGGNQQKVLIGRCLERVGTKLLLLDDPSRGVDVRGRADIHRLVRHAAAAGTPVLFASTELDELLELSDVIVTMFRGEIVSTVDREHARASTVLAEMTHARQVVPAAPERS
jgi:ABC-type sugar transport system ATPase subunit